MVLRPNGIVNLIRMVPCPLTAVVESLLWPRKHFAIVSGFGGYFVAVLARLLSGFDCWFVLARFSTPGERRQKPNMSGENSRGPSLSGFGD